MIILHLNSELYVSDNYASIGSFSGLALVRRQAMSEPKVCSLCRVIARFFLGDGYKHEHFVLYHVHFVYAYC